MLELIEKNVQYANKIISDLMEYSIEIRLEITETDPKSVIGEALSLVRTPKHIKVVDATQHEPKIEVDMEKIKRTFINIIKNAFEAMPTAGTLTVKSQRSGDDVEIAFTDTGTGMTQDVIEKLWTPFLTTKAKGMGLGLPVCKRIVEAHGGKISAKSSAGKGTTFTVTIPSRQKTEENRKEKDLLQPRRSVAPGNF
jgi:signal transduction histidine kinase